MTILVLDIKGCCNFPKSAEDGQSVTDIFNVSWENLVPAGGDPYSRVEQGALVFTGYIKQAPSLRPRRTTRRLGGPYGVPICSFY